MNTYFIAESFMKGLKEGTLLICQFIGQRITANLLLKGDTMKLKIKKEFFDKIKSGKKNFEYRDAHITFICEETKEKLRKDIHFVQMISREWLPKELRERNDLFEDNIILKMELR